MEQLKGRAVLKMMQDAVVGRRHACAVGCRRPPVHTAGAPPSTGLGRARIRAAPCLPSCAICVPVCCRSYAWWCSCMPVITRLATQQGRADLAMAILLRLGRPDILPFIEEHGLFQVGSAGNDHFCRMPNSLPPYLCTHLKRCGLAAVSSAVLYRPHCWICCCCRQLARTRSSCCKLMRQARRSCLSSTTTRCCPTLWSPASRYTLCPHHLKLTTRMR